MLQAAPNDLVRRIEQRRAVVPAEILGVPADCGFTALSRYIARQKLEIMVARARLVRGRTQGSN